MGKTKRRVIQAYTGGIARQQIAMIAARDDLELVGTLVFHEEKVGLDAGEIAGVGPLGVVATNRLEDLLDVPADVVLYNPKVDDLTEVMAFLAAGKNVITCAGGTNAKMKPEFADLEAACHAGGTSFMGTGINPGLAPDVLPMVASSICSEVEQVHVFAGGNLLGLDSSGIGIMGFGQPLHSESEDSLFIQHAVRSYRETAYFLAESVSLPIDDLVVEAEFEPARETFDAGSLRVERGSIAGVRLRLVGMIGDRRAAILENTWFLGRKNVRDDWLGPARDSGWTVRLQGSPNVELNLDVDLTGDREAGQRLTAARMINSIPTICDAAPGALTYLDVPIPRIHPS